MKIYTTYQCSLRSCRKEFILLTEDIQGAKDNGRYIACPYCSSKKVKKQNEADSVKECMKHSVYKRENGAMKQIR